MLINLKNAKIGHPSIPLVPSSKLTPLATSDERGTSRQRKHSEMDRRIEVTMARELAILEKKIKLAEEESNKIKEENLTL
jgi:hypothetical protein